ncbi:probable bifunctional methylenetetrahydrofolate dehydrogenase/cyclohydrolase 2 isoform X1 [Sinocyclocheilus grahami]|uniref:probable bifunctional methylenetetrahydrofolate dehydrogenase/cyclohydrolase 2 isoform X1 n=1 Tax=Sinocyclocheilus grahami TaxID=75366 RepID=UPI0007AC55C5|nr:PREDICTED: probable bifunctional methylenetetrahydrofolate dehydrogenase/cyclohydrolase 2 isoform X1 [Sinocyclocheilus grahami]
MQLKFQMKFKQQLLTLSSITVCLRGWTKGSTHSESKHCGIYCQAFFQNDKRHAATVVSGTELARQIHKEVQSDIAKLVAQGNRRPHLSVILVGNDHASHTYVRNKTRAASLLGMSSSTIFRPSSVSQEEMLELIDKFNRDRSISGLLVQLPLPEHINERAICNAVAPEKDVDGFHIVNTGKLCLDQRCMVPATAAAVWEIIRRTGIETVGKNVLVVGRSKNVGMPIAMLLHSDRNHERPGGDATVIMAHRCTPLPRLKELASLADIVIAAAGVPHLITADMVKEGAAVIDVGINRMQDPVTGKLRLVGDVDFEAVKEKAGFITPVPGGVGPMTIAMVMKNTVTAAKNAPTY